VNKYKVGVVKKGKKNFFSIFYLQFCLDYFFEVEKNKTEINAQSTTFYLFFSPK
jgi:hypothetical protein